MVEEYRAKGAPPPSDEAAPPSGGPHKYRRVFHGPPVTAPGGHVPFHIPEEWADDLGRHLQSLGFVTREEAAALAVNGLIDVSALPEPTIRHDPPSAGPSDWNNPGPWVPVSTPVPATSVVEPPDLTGLSDTEADAVAAESEAIQEALRIREAWKARLAEADPVEGGGDGDNTER